MKFIVSSTALSSHLQAISRVINSKNALPILDCFLFELQDGTLSATVSDSETTMVTTVEVNESDMDGRFAVTAKTLLDALKEIPEQPLTFEINTDSLEITVQYQNGKYSLMGQNADEFPQSAMLGENAVRVEMDAQVLLGGINRAVFATADDELRPVMNRNLQRTRIDVKRQRLFGDFLQSVQQSLGSHCKTSVGITFIHFDCGNHRCFTVGNSYRQGSVL